MRLNYSGFSRQGMPSDRNGSGSDLEPQEFFRTLSGTCPCTCMLFVFPAGVLTEPKVGFVGREGGFNCLPFRDTRRGTSPLADGLATIFPLSTAAPRRVLCSPTPGASHCISPTPVIARSSMADDEAASDIFEARARQVRSAVDMLVLALGSEGASFRRRNETRKSGRHSSK